MGATTKKILIWVSVIIVALILGVVVWNILPKDFRIYTTIGWVIGAIIGSGSTYVIYKWWIANVKK